MISKDGKTLTTAAGISVCAHGLTDEATVEVKTTIEDRKLGTRMTCMAYWCEEHRRYGTFTVHETL